MARLLLLLSVLAHLSCSRHAPGKPIATAEDAAVPNCAQGTPCPSGQRCYQADCIPDNGLCQTDDECQNDTYCDCLGGGSASGNDGGLCVGGVCVPWGLGPRGLFNPDCISPGFSPADFESPTVKCQWTDSDVITTPLLVDLDLDQQPEIVINTYPAGDLIALHGKDCTVVWSKSPKLGNFSQIAAADLDGDMYPEIIGINQTAKLMVFDHSGTLLATSATAYMGGGSGSDCTAPAVVDVDGQAPPEIAVSGMIARYTKAQGITVLFNNASTPATWGTVSVAADLDGDGTPELITGREVYDAKSGAGKTPSGWSQLSGPGAYPAVADLNGDKKPEVILVQSKVGNETVSVWDWANQKFIFGPLAISGGFGGPPTVADFDGDGTPDFGTAGPTDYFVFAMKCWPNGGNGCVAPGILWKKATHDVSSGGTASSVFDFNGDKKAEVVYRDECFFRVMDGTTGKTLFAREITSGTCLENPIVGDVDNDQHADVVVPSDNVQGNNCSGVKDADTGLIWKTQTQGIFVLQDPKNRWMPSRAIWNQHGYHITNVNDNATVPTVEQDSWKSWNSYRQNVQGAVIGPAAANADFTSGVSVGIDSSSDCVTSWTLRASLCNRGAASVNSGVPGTFYSTDPRKPNAKKICSTTTSGPLQPGTCEAVSCEWDAPPKQPLDLYFLANDDGKGTMPRSECWRMNDLLTIPGAICTKIG